MTQILKQSTAVDILIGPFVDLADGATAEVGETPSVKLSKNGQALAAKNDITTPVHDADGYYNCELDATDTNTVGTLVVTVAASATALPVRHELQVVEEATYDFLYAAAATPIADINAEVDTGIADAALATAAALATVDANVDAILLDTAEIGTAGAGLTAIPWNAAWDAEVESEVNDALVANHLDHLLAVDYDPAAKPGIATALLNELVESNLGVSRFTAAALAQGPVATGFSTHTAADVWSVATRVLTANTNLNDPTAAAVADAVWDEAQADHVAAGSFGETATEIASILADTNELQTDDVPGLIAALNDPTAAVIADAVWDELIADHIAAGSYGLAVQPLRANVATAGAAGTVTLDAGASTTADLFNGCVIALVNGPGAGQARLITDYSIGRVASVEPNWTTNPASGTEFVIYPAGSANLRTATQASIDAVESDTNEMQTDNVPGLIAALNDPTAAAVADAVWDEAQAGHVAVGSFGELATEIASILADTNELQTDDVPGLIAALNDPTAAAIADAVWDEAQAAHVAAGSFGETATEIASILADTNELQADWANGGRLDLILDARAAQATADAIETDTQDIQARLPAALTAGGHMSADMLAISGDTGAADKLEEGATAIVLGAVNDVSATATAFVTDLTEATDDHYIGRIVTFTTGALLGQSTDITDYNGTTKALTVSALTEAPPNGSNFVIT